MLTEGLSEGTSADSSEFCYWVQSFGFRAYGLGFRVQRLGFRVAVLLALQAMLGIMYQSFLEFHLESCEPQLTIRVILRDLHIHMSYSLNS